MKLALAFAGALLSVSQALAMGDAVSCDEAALRAAETHGVPPQVMLAITRVETGRSLEGSLQPWPWAVNQAGNSHWFDDPQQAEAFVSEAVDAGQSNIDIGCFQLNLRWHGENFESLRTMFDPLRNADYAARFLAENYKRKGNWVDAVAAYHSETPAYAALYIEKVERVLGLLKQAPTENLRVSPEPKASRENRFPLLQPGGGMALASLVPASRQRIPLFAPAP